MDVGTRLAEEIFSGSFDFDRICLEVFRFQYEHNNIYQAYVNALGADVSKISAPCQIPFLPIRFLKRTRWLQPFLKRILFLKAAVLPKPLIAGIM